MKRGLAIQRWLKWSGAGICLFILIAAGVNWKWNITWVSPSSHFVASIANGAIQMTWIFRGRFAADGGWEAQQIRGGWATYGLWPDGAGPLPIGYVNIPLWMLFLATAGLTAWLWRGNRRRVPPGYCQKCGYNLTGNVSGRCPECGAVATEKIAEVKVSEGTE